MGRKRIYKDDAERKRAWYQRQQLAKGKVINVNQRVPLTAVELIQPELIDTRQWSWKKWCVTFYGWDIEQYMENSLECYDMYMRLLNEVPRRHWKTTGMNRVYVVRKLCETVFTKRDQNIIYMSNNTDNIRDFVILIDDDLTFNERIIENYGFLLEVINIEVERARSSRSRNRQSRQTAIILNLSNRKDKFNHSLQVITVMGSIRGKGATTVIIDDPVDTIHNATPESRRKITKKLLISLKQRIYPLVTANIVLSGTRYDIDGMDIYSILAREFGGHIWKQIERRAVIKYGSYKIRELTTEQKLKPTDIIIDDYSEWQILSIGAWQYRANELNNAMGIECDYLQALIYMMETMEKHHWEQEYQNNPITLGGIIDFTDFQPYDTVNPIGRLGKWLCYVDLSASEKDEQRYTSIILMGSPKQADIYYLHDMLTGKWPAKKKMQEIVRFVRSWEDKLNITLPLYIETAIAQGMDIYQFMRDDYSDISIKRFEQKGRGDKIWRIEHGLVLALPRKKIFLSKHCRSTQDLKSECDAFPNLHPEALDAVDTSYHILKKASRPYKLGRLQDA